MRPSTGERLVPRVPALLRMQCDTSKCFTIQKQQNFTNIKHLPLYFVQKMPGNEGFESQTDTEGSTGSEDIAEQKSVVQPYQFEPVADSD